MFAPEARLTAQGAEAAIRAGHSTGLLHGVPIALKDLIEIEGKVVTGGSEVWTQRMATGTATLARRLMAQGMVVLGKTYTVSLPLHRSDWRAGDPHPALSHGPHDVCPPAGSSEDPSSGSCENQST